eukprot:TRINITY_DN37224_c0_g1_i2.p2 TRINITY_DN37224_c0_g1~~TRINITY_DN37224_c0_g1_i2.p2  ORF type:complete len:240 (+),score=50.52 TRINITY_DN37224_c0_g1_i2:40-720(+)
MSVGVALRHVLLICCFRLDLCSDRGVEGDVDFDLDLDDAIDALDKLKDRHAEKRQIASEDIGVHRRTMETLDASEYFAKSTAARQRTYHPEVTFEIGQVVWHKLWGYTAVIVGWDEICKAPEAWIQRMHQAAPKNSEVQWRTIPNYSVLVVKDGSGSGDVRYVPQVNIVRVTGADALVESDDIDTYFQRFEKGCDQFVARPWLQERYPEDGRRCTASTGHIPRAEF